jgi:hypothetical protein
VPLAFSSGQLQGAKQQGLLKGDRPAGEARLLEREGVSDLRGLDPVGTGFLCGQIEVEENRIDVSSAACTGEKVA